MSPFVIDVGPPIVYFYPLEPFQNLLWRSIYPEVTGSYIQFAMQYSIADMQDAGTSLADFQLHAMLFYAMPTSDRFQ